MPKASSLVLVTLLLIGCASTTSKLKSRFAVERSCPESQVEVNESGGTVYRATGCGKSAEYVCPSFAGSTDDRARSCEERNRRRQSGPPHDSPSLPEAIDDESAPGPPH